MRGMLPVVSVASYVLVCADNSSIHFSTNNQHAPTQTQQDAFNKNTTNLGQASGRTPCRTHKPTNSFFADDGGQNGHDEGGRRPRRGPVGRDSGELDTMLAFGGQRVVLWRKMAPKLSVGFCGGFNNKTYRNTQTCAIIRVSWHFGFLQNAHGHCPRTLRGNERALQQKNYNDTKTPKVEQNAKQQTIVPRQRSRPLPRNLLGLVPRRAPRFPTRWSCLRRQHGIDSCLCVVVVVDVGVVRQLLWTLALFMGVVS